MAAETPHTDAAPAEAGMPQFAFDTWTSQIVWLVITFGILYFVLSRFILPKIGGGITERSDRIADDLDAAGRMQKEAEQAGLEYERAVADAKAKAHNIAETTRKSVDAEIAKEVEAAEHDFSVKQASADARIRKIKDAAMAKIDTVAADTTSALVEKLLDSKPAAATIKAAITRAKGLGHD